MIIQNQLFLTICHHITDICICILPPLNVCHLCQMCMKPQVRPAGPISSSPLLPLLWEFGSDGVIMSPFSSLFPSSSLLVVLSLITYSPSSSLFSYSTSLLSALFCRQYLSETRNLKVQIFLFTFTKSEIKSTIQILVQLSVHHNDLLMKFFDP